MSGKRFLDTNILIYAFARGDSRQSAAESLLDRNSIISVQVLNEFANVSSRKLGLAWDVINERIEVLCDLLPPPESITLAVHSAAREIASSRKISFYDAMIVASADASGCKELLTEDLQHGTKFGAVRVRNPFIEN